jgi:magnesium transporter
VIVESAIYVNGRRSAPCSPGETREVSREKGGFAWIGLQNPTPDELGSVAGEFGLPETVLRDVPGRHQRSKLERYEGALLVVLKAARYGERGDVEFDEIRVFLGPDFVVTVSYGASDGFVAEAQRRIESEPEPLRRGPVAVLYAVLDRIVNDYEPVVESLEDDIDEVEERVFEGSPAASRGVSRRIYELSHEVIRFHQAAHPLAVALGRLADGTTSGIEAPEVRERLRGLHDRVLRVTERVAGLRELLTNILNVNLTVISIDQNDQVKKISGWGAIVIVPTLIAGIYGMNFDYIPELHWRYGYLFALSLMALIALALYLGFKRSDWL